MSGKPNLKQLSKQTFVLPANQEKPTPDFINVGSFQRIADAMELMAEDYSKLKKDAEDYKRWYNEEQTEKLALIRTVSAYKGHIKRLKNKLNK